MSRFALDVSSTEQSLLDAAADLEALVARGDVPAEEAAARRERVLAVLKGTVTEGVTLPGNAVAPDCSLSESRANPWPSRTITSDHKSLAVIHTHRVSMLITSTRRSASEQCMEAEWQ